MKRALDVAVALAALLVLAVPLALIAALIWASDRKSPLYRGVRVGRGCRGFAMLKFRTMIPEAWKNGVSSTAAGDPRITRLGRRLRAAKLDELPQLWNVLRGQMSLVGPRPQVPDEVRLYTVEECRLLEVRPGMTDLASIVFNDEGRILEGAADAGLRYNQIIRPWKNRLALAQIARPSLLTDLRVLVWTLQAALARPRVLRRIERLLVSWNQPAELLRVVLRREPLPEAPPPGAREVVRSGARAEGAGA